MNHIQSKLLALSGSALFAEAIEQARDIMLKAPWLQYSANPALEQAAAERQLKHQISAALDQGFILHDPMHPEFRCLNQHNQFGLVNPDNRYTLASISTPGTYRIVGRRGTSADLQIQVGSGEPGFDEDLTSPIPVAEMSRDQLTTDDDGRFEIYISEAEMGENWLPNKKGRREANSILIRESFMDWNTETAGTWYIERLDTRGEPNPLPSADLVSDQYARAAQYLVSSTKGWVKFVDRLRANLPANQLSPPRPTQKGLPGQFNAAGHFPIHDRDAVIITVPKSDARYQGIQIGDLWFNGLDFCHRQTSLTTKQARQTDADNHHFVISTKDPEIENWLDPAGASHVFAFLRWQGLPSDVETLAPAVARPVPFHELRKYLPDEPVFTAAQRKEQLAARQAMALTSPRGF